MHKPRIVAGEDGTSGPLVKFIGLCVRSSQSRERLFIATRNEFDVSETLVITSVGQELCAVFKEVLQIIITDARFGLERCPIAIAAVVERDDEVVNVL